MSFLLEALKRAEQERRRKEVRERKVPEPPTSEPAADSPGWQVRMVSPCRYERVKVEPGRAEDRPPAGSWLWEPVASGARHDTSPDLPLLTEEERRRRLLTTRRVAGAIVTLLLLLAGALAYHVLLRPAAVTPDLNALTRQINETQAHLARLDGELLRLSVENNALRQENAAVGAELARVRATLHARNAQQQRSPGKGQPSAVDQVGPGSVPPTTPPLPPPAGPPPRLDVVETPSIKVYSIR